MVERSVEIAAHAESRELQPAACLNMVGAITQLEIIRRLPEIIDTHPPLRNKLMLSIRSYSFCVDFRNDPIAALANTERICQESRRQDNLTRISYFDELRLLRGYYIKPDIMFASRFLYESETAEQLSFLADNPLLANYLYELPPVLDFAIQETAPKRIGIGMHAFGSVLEELVARSVSWCEEYADLRAQGLLED